MSRARRFLTLAQFVALVMLFCAVGITSALAYGWCYTDTTMGGHAFFAIVVLMVPIAFVAGLSFAELA